MTAQAGAVAAWADSRDLAERECFDILACSDKYKAVSTHPLRYDTPLYLAPPAALPAGGGVVAEVCMDQSGCKYLRWSPGLEELPAVGTKLCTTPQPSAAEELGPHPLNICPKCKDYYMECDCPADAAKNLSFDPASIGPFTATAALMQDTDAAVGAQGEEEGAVTCRVLTFDGERIAVPSRIFHRVHDALLGAALESATPAAGKGVDEHPDDLAVDRFAAAMKAKLAKKRAEGRGGWDDPAQCSVELLSNLLHEHVAKGDPVDVGNLAMMLHQRGSGVLPPQGDLQSDLDLIWHSVSDTKETNAAHARLKAALTRQPVAGDGEVANG